MHNTIIRIEDATPELIRAIVEAHDEVIRAKGKTYPVSSKELQEAYNTITKRRITQKFRYITSKGYVVREGTFTECEEARSKYRLNDCTVQEVKDKDET